MKTFNEKVIKKESFTITVCDYETAKKNGECVWIEDNQNHKMCIDLDTLKIIYKEI